MTGRVRRTAAWAVVPLVGLLLIPVAANAAAGAKATVTAPGEVTVGQKGVAASITLENRNTPLENDDPNTVCNAAEALAPCTAPERGIVLVPSCGQLTGSACAVADPGVFRVSPAGVGRAGTACAGMRFATTVIEPALGTVRFTPQPATARVLLPVTGSKCEIGFTFDVLRAPRADANAGAAGIQTAQLTEHKQYVGLIGPGAMFATARGTLNGITVITPPPPPPPKLGDIALFTTSPKSLRVSKAGRFTYTFLATPGRKGKARLTSTKSVKVGKKKRKLKVPAKSFKVPANAVVKVKFRLSPASLRALKKRPSLQFKVDVTIGTTKFSAKLKLKRPKKS